MALLVIGSIENSQIYEVKLLNPIAQAHFQSLLLDAIAALLYNTGSRCAGQCDGATKTLFHEIRPAAKRKTVI